MSYTNARTTAKYNTSPSTTIPELGIRETCKEYGKEYVIENVATCNDLHDPIRLNGYAFDRAINMTRKFETSFNIDEKHKSYKNPRYEQEGFKRYSCHNMQEAKKEDLIHLKDAPESLTVPELRSYIPPFYVHYILDNIDRKIETVLDLCCGGGGVGHALKSRGITHVGIDVMDKSDSYPGPFVHGDVRQSEAIEKALELLD